MESGEFENLKLNYIWRSEGITFGDQKGVAEFKIKLHLEIC
jgi:hypothetical protein